MATKVHKVLKVQLGLPQLVVVETKGLKEVKVRKDLLEILVLVATKVQLADRVIKVHKDYKVQKDLRVI